MELYERQIKFVRAIMPKLYEMQAAVDMWTDAIEKLHAENMKKEVGFCRQTKQELDL